MENNLHNSTENELSQKRYRELIEFGQIIFGALDFRSIQKKAVQKLRKLFNCESVSLYIFEEKNNSLCSWLTDEKGVEHSLSINVGEETFEGTCAFYKGILHYGKEELIRDLRYARRHEKIKSENWNEILLVPMVHNGELLGVINLINPLAGEFTAEDIEFIKHLANQLGSSIENAKLFQKLKEQFVQICGALGDAISKKDTYTGGHTRRVAMFSEMIGKELNLSAAEIGDLKLSAALHDIGKIGIEDKILKKDSPLTTEEFKVMMEHPRLGHEILQHIDGLEKIVDGMRFHHERFDGEGYPYGLKHDEIPLIAQIIAVADTFDAMISTRPYRKGLPPMQAYQEILKCSGSQFCPRIVEAFDRAFQKTSMFRSTDFLAQNKKAG